MKKYISFFIFSLAWMVSYGQTGTKNYILSRTYKQKGATVNDISKVQIQVNYLDGFGRPVQAVNVGQSNTGTDIVTPMEYDAYGRELKKFLPYSTTGTNGYFQGSGAASQATYYSTNNVPQLQGPASDLGQAFDYTVPDTSPLNRPLGQRGPGTKSAASVITYGSNTAGEVKNYYYTPNANISLTVAVNGNYAAGRLSRTQTTDENGKVSIEFKDLQGRIICTKMVYSTTETLDTYYVYDDFGQLRAVLQPEYQDTPDAGKFAFVYGYDSRGRQIMKKKPGAVVEYMVYDKLDRLVMYNDGVLQIKGWNNLGIWMFIKYDSLSRPIMYGGLSESRNRAQLQTLFDNSNNLSEYKTTTGIGYTMAYTYPLISEGHVHEVVYYDDYTFPKAANLAYNSTAGYYSSYNNAVKSKVTGGRIRILLPNYVVTGWLTNAVYYDDEYRTIQTTRELYDMGASAIERVSTKYKYDLAAVVEQEKTEQLLSTTLTNSLLKTYTYDHVDRLLSIKEKVTQGANTKEATTVAHRYNALGQLKQKWIHSTDAINFRRRITYTDNIRGWQTEVKTQYKQTSGGSDLPFFGYGLDYVNGSNYTNGNISSMQWNGKDESSFTKGMSFIYDDANRLTTSTGLYSYTDLENGLTYSKNGNIKTLTRSGASVDNLSYIYNGNQLTSLTDASGNNSGVKNGVSTYTYDYNGNTLSDGNRGITISYNQRNLPQVIKKGTDSLIYFYDSWGRKHKYIADTITIKYAGPFDYRLVGTANSLNRVSLSEGQAVYRGGALRFEYYLKDHLGNTRVVFDESGSIIQKSDYYPFGLEIDRNNPVQPLATRNAVNRYGFLGKEIQVASGYIDLQARFYDPALGRFLSQDPLAEKFTESSLYMYGNNNPVLMVDPDGMASRYNWATGSYMNNGEVVDFDQVKQEYGIGSENCCPDKKTDISNSPNVKAAEAKQPFGIQARLAESGAQSGVPLPAVDGIESDHTLEFAIIPLAKPVEWAAKPLLGLIRAQWLASATVKGGIANSRALGLAGEQAVGVGSKTRIPSLTGTAKFRIPDQLTATTLEEVKNVSHLNLTRQLKDFHIFSQQTGRQLIIYTRPTTTFSGPLQNLINNGSVVIKPIPFK